MAQTKGLCKFCVYIMFQRSVTVGYNLIKTILNCFYHSVQFYCIFPMSQDLTRYVRQHWTTNKLLYWCMLQICTTPAAKLQFLTRFIPFQCMSGHWFKLILSAISLILFLVLLDIHIPSSQSKPKQTFKESVLTPTICPCNR